MKGLTRGELNLLFERHTNTTSQAGKQATFYVRMADYCGSKMHPLLQPRAKKVRRIPSKAAAVRVEAQAAEGVLFEYCVPGGGKLELRLTDRSVASLGSAELRLIADLKEVIERSVPRKQAKTEGGGAGEEFGT